MQTIARHIGCVLVSLSSLAVGIATAQPPEIPPVLQPWKGWATWGVKHQNCPTPFSGGDRHLCFWPSRLTLSADPEKGSWSTAVTVFEDTWIPLPGDSDVWPVNVNDNGKPLPVVEHNGVPSISLPPGLHQLTGEFPWDEMPQRIAIPKEVGILSLVVDGNPVPIPNWDADGYVWLKRLRAEAADQDLLAVQVYRVIEDGIPMWLRTDIELTVSGKSREEQLGWALPEGWILSQVESPLPAAIDDQGRLKVQVRAGKWVISLHAFQTTNAPTVRFEAGAKPLVASELVSFQVSPEFRMAEIEGLPAIDVTQTTFPQKWRHLPVYGWKTDQTFRIAEKMRGMGTQRPEGLHLNRELWLDEGGQGFTYRDRFRGQMQQIWRLDIAAGQELGAVRIDDKGQLITANPETGAHGVEIRNRNLNMEAIGRMSRGSELPATGWQSDADNLQVLLMLPPGWRVFAVFGADRVDGDWLTAWSLLDLFLLLILSLAALRLWGFRAGLLALVAFGLSYHEPGSPRVTWFFLLMPVALLRVVPEGASKRWITVWKMLAAALLLLSLVPFVARQVQSAIYPQLERPGVMYAPRSMFTWLGRAYDRSVSVAEYLQDGSTSIAHAPNRFGLESKLSNLQFEPTARIQTGPAAPEWTWIQVSCVWNGPVSADQRIRPILVSLAWNRLVTVVRLTFLLLLAAIFFGIPKIRNPFGKRSAAAAVALAALLSPGILSAQIPDNQMLDTLRQRLLEPSDAYPHAGEIPTAALRIDKGRLTMDVEVHAAVDVAIPLPGRLPEWSPVSVQIDGKPNALVCRSEGYLWVTVPKGVHKVSVEGLLPDVTEWQWTFLLKPRYVTIEAPGWTISGVRPNGMPEQQVFFARVRQATAGEAAYDQKSFNAIVALERKLEIGLAWKTHNVVTRLSAPGKAVSLKIPVLKGERVLTPNVVVENGLVEVRLGAGETNFQWDSQLPVVGSIHLAAEPTDQWVERWQLVTSPVWNVSLSGLAPIFDARQQDLIPIWLPWPGEDVTLGFHQPDAVSGDTVTVHRVRHDSSLGSRQRTAALKMDLESSLGTDFVVELDPDAEITSLKVDGRVIPVRRDGPRLMVPLHPGRQSVDIAWRTSEAMRTVVSTGQITLPIEGSNITTVLVVPEDRWVLWAHGPLRGPAVRFWTILVCAILTAVALGSYSSSPLSRLEWVLLAIGLTQVHVSAAMFVVGWLFLLSWRGKRDPDRMRTWHFNLLQIALVFLTFLVLGILIVVVGEGLLGDPKMFIVGNGSFRTVLNWYEPRVAGTLPEPYVVSVSIWFYRLLMLLWALWLANALLRWLKWGWIQFSHGGGWKRWRKKQLATPFAPDA